MINPVDPSFIELDTQYAGITERALRAFVLAQCAAGQTVVALTTDSASAVGDVERCERELDQIDREVDATIASAIFESTGGQSRDLLTCMKFILDLERIGDLLSSVSSCASTLGARVSMDDVADLVRMCSVLERMIADAHRAYAARNVDLAMNVLRMDSEIDRLRNLMMIRHLEQAQIRITHDSVQVLFMAQSLERAGDHAKNLAEEVCHVISGQSIRHLVRTSAQPTEQMYLNWLRENTTSRTSGKNL
jgi:phosphate transport system protein